MHACTICSRFSCDCVKQIKERIYLPDLVAQDLPPGKRLRGKGSRFTAPCPFHGSSGNDLSLFINRNGGWSFRCFGAKCERRGDVIEYVMERKGINFLEALADLSGATLSMPIPARGPQEPPRATDGPKLDQSLAMAYHAALGAAHEPTEARLWWHAQGVRDISIDRWTLGYCLRCPTAYNDDFPSWTSPSFTIPVNENEQLLNIRHRLSNPLDAGDKYRPQKPGLGAQLFNSDSLSLLPDGSSRTDRRTAVILEGEKKVIVVAQSGLEAQYPFVTSTAGATSWLGDLGEAWKERFDDYDQIITLFDPGAEEAAEHTARLFGRRGYVASALPEKVDDLLIQYGEQGLTLLRRAIEEAQPVMNHYWQQFLPEQGTRTMR